MTVNRHSWVWLTVPRLRFWLWRMTSFWAQTSESTVKTHHLSNWDTGAMGSYFSQLLSSRGFAYRSFIIFQILYWPFWILVENVIESERPPIRIRLNHHQSTIKSPELFFNCHNGWLSTIAEVPCAVWSPQLPPVLTRRDDHAPPRQMVKYSGLAVVITDIIDIMG